MPGPAVSIIIPVYNSEKTLAAGLEKILQQSYTDFEIVLVDGASTDSSLQIIRDFSRRDRRIVWVSEPDKGIYDAMNKGLLMAKGEWALFLGSDDELHGDDVLERVFPAAFPQEINVVYGNTEIVGDASWAKNGAIYDGPFDLPKLLNKNICHQSIFYRTGFVKNRVGYYNIDYKVCADWDLNLRCWAQSPFHYLDLTVARFFAGGESTRTPYDHAFTGQYLRNVLTYFKLSPFDPLVNRTSFPDYYKVTQLQKKENWLRYMVNKFIKKIHPGK